ncbi:uncharacterized protein LOC133242703 [Bos javanicus]|uniref:uncharacterized protein LOC133242703 n=1 Tax=Bos javanicus TaxID=9906 RepID=UPI002AA73C95|nr:uncharacterized protein LOC133242703 [Bos javanicus]
MDPRVSTEHKQPVSFCGETRRGTLSSFGAAELGHCEPRAASASGGSLPAPKRNERAEAAGGQRDPDKMIQIFLQLRKTFSKLSSYALVGTASPWVLGLTLCSSYLYLCPPLPDEFLEARTWSAVLISIAIDFFLVLPPTPQATEGPGGRTPCLQKASSFMLGGCGEGFSCFPGQGCCLSSSSTSSAYSYCFEKKWYYMVHRKVRKETTSICNACPSPKIL